MVNQNPVAFINCRRNFVEIVDQNGRLAFCRIDYFDRRSLLLAGVVFGAAWIFLADLIMDLTK